MDHDATQQATILNQTLGQDKRPIGLFVGAGCPSSIRVEHDGRIEPLVPDIAGLTAKVCERFGYGGRPDDDRLCKVCSALCEDGATPPNYEQILSQVRTIAPAIGIQSWSGLIRSDFEQIERNLCSYIVEQVSRELPSSDTPYNEVARWIGSAQRDAPVEIFTTNYDLLMEQALEAARVPYFDGFTGARRAFFDPYAIEEEEMPKRWARLWKLHGSINWHHDASDDTVWRGEQSGDGVLIHPSHLKYAQSRRMPYLTMIDRLATFLGRPSAALVTCGYSFQDEHLNEVIARGLQRNPTAVGFALMYGPLAECAKAAALARSRGNLLLLARDAAVIGGDSGIWTASDMGPFQDDPLPPVEEDGEGGTRFLLGDFARFGSFLAGLSGLRCWRPNG